MSTCLVLCRNQHLKLRLESGEVVIVDQFWWEGTAASSLWLLCSNSDQPKIISDKCISKKGAYKYFPHMLLLCTECSAYTLVTTRRKQIFIYSKCCRSEKEDEGSSSCPTYSFKWIWLLKIYNLLKRNQLFTIPMFPSAVSLLSFYLYVCNS